MWLELRGEERARGLGPCSLAPPSLLRPLTGQVQQAAGSFSNSTPWLSSSVFPHRLLFFLEDKSDGAQVPGTLPSSLLPNLLSFLSSPGLPGLLSVFVPRH